VTLKIQHIVNKAMSA